MGIRDWLQRDSRVGWLCVIDGIANGHLWCREWLGRSPGCPEVQEMLSHTSWVAVAPEGMKRRDRCDLPSACRARKVNVFLPTRFPKSQNPGAGEGLLALVSTATQQRDSSLCPACPPSSLSICHAPHFLQLTNVHSLTRPTASLDMFWCFCLWPSSPGAFLSISISDTQWLELFQGSRERHYVLPQTGGYSVIMWFCSTTILLFIRWNGPLKLF